MKIALVLVVILINVFSSSEGALIGPNNPMFGSDYFALENMAWGRPTKFFNYDYRRYNKDKTDDDDNSYDEDVDLFEHKRRYRPSLYKRRYRPGTKLVGEDLMKRGLYGLWKPTGKRGLFGLWKPAQLVGKVNKRQVIEYGHVLRLFVNPMKN